MKKEWKSVEVGLWEDMVLANHKRAQEFCFAAVCSSGACYDAVVLKGCSVAVVLGAAWQHTASIFL